MMPKLSHAFLAAGLLFSPALHAQTEGEDLVPLVSPAEEVRTTAPQFGDYDLRLWSTDDGLPHNSVSQVLRDHDGFLWFATVGGLARFDGKRFLEFRPPPEHCPQGYNIRSLTVDRTGRILVVPTSGSLLSLAGGLWQTHPAAAHLKERGESAEEIFCSPTGVLWIGTNKGTVLRCSQDNELTVFEVSTQPGRHVRRWSFAQDAQDRTLIAADGFLARETEKGLEPLLPSPGKALLLGQGRSGRVWLASERGLYCVEHGRLSLACEKVPWKDDPWLLRQLHEDAQGRLSFAHSRRGLLRHQNGVFIQDLHRLQLVKALAEDREGNLWVCTDGRGIAQLLPKAYSLLTQNDGLVHEVVSSVACDAQGRSYLANRGGGVAVGSGSAPLHQANQGPGPRIYANVVTHTADGGLWAGGGTSGLYHWNPDAGERPRKMPMPEQTLHVLFPAKDGTLWFAAAPDQLGYYQGEQPRLMTEAEGPHPRSVRCFAQENGGLLWAGGIDGLLGSWDGTRWTLQDPFAGQARLPLHSLLIDSENRLWLGTPGGLLLREGGRFHVFGREQGLEDDIILGLAEDDRGRLWIASRRGLFHVRRQDLVDLAQGRRTRIVSEILRHGGDLSGLSITPNYQPVCARASDGRLWFATSQGALVVSPALVPDRPPPPPVFIEDLRLDGAPLPATETTPRLPSGRHRLEFRLTPLAFGALGRTELRHRLEGLEPDWVSTGDTSLVAYTNLPPGSYRLLAAARSGNGDWSDTPAILSFVVVPAWWETGAARLGGLLLLTGLTAFLVRSLALRRLRRRLLRLEQENLLERERLRIARDLHDELGAGLTELGLLADRIAGGAPTDKASPLHDLATRSRRLSTDLSGLVWELGPRNHTLARLGQFLGQYTRRVFKGLPQRCTIEGNEELPEIPLSPELQHHLLAATKEALNNCLKHSGATEVSIKMLHKDGSLSILVRDNGRGFVPELCGADGNGLRNMRSRLTEIGGTVTLRSAPGQGAEVELKAPLTQARQVT